jgi:thioredoxin 1
MVPTQYGMIFFECKFIMENEMFKEPINVTDDAFERVVLQSDLPVVVDFWAPWCGPCKMIEPALNNLAKEHAGKLIVARINTDDNPKWAQEYDVRGIPTILFFGNGKILHRQVGAVPEVYLRDMVDGLLNAIEETFE